MASHETQKDEVSSILKLKLGPPPVPPLGVVADGVAVAHSDPLGNGPVLLQLLGQLLLDTEGLVGRLKMKIHLFTRQITLDTLG